ncbi:hypothetical protein [Paractinoplanes brasiliensis]|uniref:Transcriptional regulator n=1 Tax=Paractinoplanes brasiliensis TaxID=52695 RepID=A0A4R6JUI2_9ACTN|nr:hypothetical protein [Actinoplanes brasiliensis]TDO38315.1 hypothetical protein C8E87_1966 [Actinoplanes brasiliensis]GID26909.1 hypothetical protein Abr02nite_18920 [Actinoplanes brasiliensis]
MARPATNHELEALLREAGYEHAHGAFARQVNHAARDQAHLCYDASTVYWRLRGRCPDRRIQELISTVLTRRIGRTISIDDLGLGGEDRQVGLHYPGSPDEAVDVGSRLWRLTVQRGALLATTPFVVAAALNTGFAWRYDSADATVAHQGRRRLLDSDIAALQIFADQFADLDRKHGGGAHHTRRIMSDFLHRQVSPMLHGSYTDTVGRRLMTAAATISGQLAFMTYDAGEHGAAQRHFTTALRLAKAADDSLYGAHLLANLATQAVYLGHGPEAVRLARAALDGAGRAPASVLARLHTTEASAHATAGDRRACTAALAKAARALAKGRPGDAPGWAGYFSPAHFAGAALRCHRDLRLHRQAIRHGPAALDVPAGNLRTRALHTALLATTYAAAGDLDEACHHGYEAIQHGRTVSSGRVRHRLAELVQVLTPHRSVTCVADFLEVHGNTTASAA